MYGKSYMKKKDELYLNIQQQIYTLNQYEGGFTAKEIADHFQMQRSNVSAILNELVNEGKLNKSNTRPVVFKLAVEFTDNSSNLVFEQLVGHNGSLRNSIELAKAAILYPNKSLNILLQSQRGVGTTRFAESIYEFAKQQRVIAKDAPFRKINARHYQKNIESMDDYLFGINRDYKDSIFVESSGGVLFIDSYEVMNASQQSEILRLIDQNIFPDVTLIISNNINNVSLLEGKLSVVIELPPLSTRPLEERFELFNHLFAKEANNSKRSIQVNSDVMQALLLSEFENNIKEASNSVKKTCALAYVRVVGNPKEMIRVTINDLDPQIKKNIVNLREHSTSISKVIGDNQTLIYDQNQGLIRKKGPNQFDLYSDIESKYNDLTTRGINQTNIENVIHTHIENLYDMFNYKDTKNTKTNLDQLSKIVDKKIIDLVEDWLKVCSRELNKIYPNNVFFGLCLHINALLTRSTKSKHIDNSQILETISKYPREYAESVKLSLILQEEFGLNLPIDEVVIFTLFLINEVQEKQQGNAVLLYVMHGDGIAKALKDVTNALTQTYKTHAYDMNLDKDTQTAMIELKDLIIQIDEGYGVIVIYDMGSIETMIETISEETNIKIRGINIPLTLVGIDIARRCAMGDDIEDIYHKATKDINLTTRKVEYLDELFITLCHTGEGGAYQLKNYIDEFSKLHVKTKALSISDRQELIKEVMALKKTYRISAFVGTYDPNLFGIPFISISKVFNTRKEYLDNVLRFEPIGEDSISYHEIYSYLEEELKYTPINKVKAVMPNLIEELKVIFNLNLDSEIGVFMHIVSLIERILAKQEQVKNENAQTILDAFQDDYKMLRKMLKEIEKSFNIVIDDNAIATIIMILRKL